MFVPEEKDKNAVFRRTQCFVRYPVDSQDEIVFEEDIAHNGEEVDEDKSQHGCQNNGTAISGHALYYVQQGLFSVNQIKELQEEEEVRCVWEMCKKKRTLSLYLKIWPNKGCSGQRTLLLFVSLPLFKSPWLNDFDGGYVQYVTNQMAPKSHFCLLFSCYCVSQCLCHVWFRFNVLCVLAYQQAVKEDMVENPQAADYQVEQVVQELHICDHGFVATCEGSPVPNKAHQEDDLIT